MFQPHKKGSAELLNVHLPPPPSVVKNWIDEDKKTNRKLSKNVHKSAKPKSISKTILPAKVVRAQLKAVLKQDIPSLQTELQAAKFHREKDARIHNGTIGELLKALNSNQITSRLKGAEIAKKNTEIAVLRQEIADLNQKLQKCQQEATPMKWSNIENEMKDIHFET